MKKISFLLISVITFICFSLNVNAKVGTQYSIVVDDLSILDTFLSYNDYVYLNDYFNEHSVSNEHNFNYNTCRIYPNWSYYYKLNQVIFDCIDDYVLKDNTSVASLSNAGLYGISHSNTPTNKIRYIYNFESNLIESSTLETYNYNDYYFNTASYNTSGSTYYHMYFWNNLFDYIPLDIDNKNLRVFVYDDNVYENISSTFKNYYDFKDYYYIGKPLYSVINLVLGNYNGYRKNIEVTYCYDNVCSDDKENIEYFYKTNDEVIDLSEYLSETKNNYKLDLNYDYKIIAGTNTSVNVYYYSTEIPYVVNYYYDDILQENLTQNLTGVAGSLIELENLDLVKDSIYFLDETKDYSLTLKSGESNVINVYYYSKDVSYSVNVYLDDIYYQSHSNTYIDKAGREIIIDNLSETINIYTLDNREYKILLTENSTLNYVNVYYYSENYDTKYQDIDTSDKFYISFDWVYIKELFSLNGVYTQTEQFVIVYVVNFLFYAIVCIFGYFGLKMINKLFSLFRMF